MQYACARMCMKVKMHVMAVIAFYRAVTKMHFYIFTHTRFMRVGHLLNKTALRIMYGRCILPCARFTKCLPVFMPFWPFYTSLWHFAFGRLCLALFISKNRLEG